MIYEKCDKKAVETRPLFTKRGCVNLIFRRRLKKVAVFFTEYFTAIQSWWKCLVWLVKYTSNNDRYQVVRGRLSEDRYHKHFKHSTQTFTNMSLEHQELVPLNFGKLRTFNLEPIFSLSGHNQISKFTP